MNKHIPLIAIVVAVLASCQPRTKDEQNVSTETKDTTASQAIKATDTGHAAIVPMITDFLDSDLNEKPATF